jgi:hypothetical protein
MVQFTIGYTRTLSLQETIDAPSLQAAEQYANFRTYREGLQDADFPDSDIKFEIKEEGTSVTNQGSLLGTKVGQRSPSEIEQIIKQGYDLTFGTEDNRLFVEITWFNGRACVLVLCHNSEVYSQGYDSMQLLQNAQPWNLSCFAIVERTRGQEPSAYA